MSDLFAEQITASRNTVFCEQLVKKNPTFLNKLVKALLIVATVLCFISGVILHPVFLFAAVAMVLLDMWLLPRQNIEYEYSYTAGELVIDEIFSKKTRKHLATFQVSDMEAFGIMQSSRLDEFRKLPMVDYTTGLEEDLKNAYVFVASVNGQKNFYAFLPKDEIVTDIRRRIPGRSYMN